MQLYQGVVENRKDPMKLGRCQVRVIGLHTHDKAQLPTKDLPWAYPMQPVTSAAMNGIGHAPVGPVEGTWVVVMFRDDDEQYPVILGTFGGIPQQFESVDADRPGVILKDDELNTPAEASDIVSDSEGNAVPTSEVASQPTTAATTPTSIPTTPPPSWRGDTNKASAGISAIIAAGTSLGLTKEQICSVLACVGGESGWIPQEEGYNYSAQGLMSTFKKTFGNNETLANTWARAPSKGISRQEFFDFVYAPENNGSQLGNTQEGDGGKYFGRGFIQLTGRANYAKYGTLANVDLINNPSILNTDIATSAKIACIYVKDRARPKDTSPSANPEYFYAAKKGIGNDVGAGGELRRQYYEYFYGEATPTSKTDEKSAAPAATAENTGTTTPTPDRTIPGPVGFRDPNNKYPLKNFIHEPDTNRLARGVKTGTIVPIKESNRAKGVPIALDQGTFDEPYSSFKAEYPFNHVFESESGHVQEFDDTPGHERIHTYHRKGTFTEIDPNGTQVNHVVGDNYQIIDRNGSLYISGKCNITVDGDINIFCQSTANIEVTGDANVEIGNNANVGVAKDANIVVDQNMNLQVNNELNIKANSINIESNTDFTVKAISIRETSSNMDVKANSYRETVGESHYRWEGDKYMYTGSDTYTVRESGRTDYSCPTTRDGETACPDIDSANNAPDVEPGLTPPEDGVPINPIIPLLITPYFEGEEAFKFETADEWLTPQGQARKAELESKYGKPATVEQDSAQPKAGTQTNNTVSCAVIDATQEFTNDFRVSQHFTLGMLIDGGVNGHNKLKDQAGLTKQEIVCNLAQLAQNILEPALAYLPGGASGYGKLWTINSGYRSTSNSTSTSDHPTGRAVDISLLPKDETRGQRHFDLIKQLEAVLPYDQMILEYSQPNSTWIHIGYRGLKTGDTAGTGGVNRKMAFTMVNGSTYKSSGFYLV